MPPPFPPWLPNAPGWEGLPTRFETKEAKRRHPPGRGLVGQAQDTHRRSRLCAVAETCRTPVRCRAQTPGGKRGRNRRDAGPPEDSGEARGVGGTQAHLLATVPGSVRRGGRVGSAGSVESRRYSGRGYLVRTPPPPRASSASQLLLTPAFQCKSFRGHADSAASSVSQSPGRRPTTGGG